MDFGTQATSTTPLTTNPNSFGSKSTDKYGGLILQSWVKRLRRDLFKLFGYIYSVAHSYHAIHLVITIFRILQFIGPSFAAGYENLWEKGTPGQKTMDIFAVLFSLIPPSVRNQYLFQYLYFYCAVKFIVLICLLFSAGYFRRNAKLPFLVPAVISLYFATLGHVLHPIAIEYICVIVSNLIWNRYEMNFIEAIVLVCVATVLSLIYFWIVLEISNQNLVFRANSLMTATSPPQNFMFCATIVVTAIMAFGGPAPKIGQLVCIGLACVMYCISLYSIFYCGGFIHMTSATLIMAGCITSALLCVFVFVTRVMDGWIQLETFFGDLVLWALALMLSRFILMRRSVRAVALLDAMLEDEEQFHTISGPNRLMSIAVIGFSVAHPFCLKWTIFRMAVERWKRNPLIWYLFAKFIAIYPEETQTLAWIYHMVCALRLKGASVRSIKEHALSIMRQREANLSADLKMRLNAIARQVQPTKHKLRHVWDVVIQGNIGEVEQSTKRALSVIEQNDAEFKHLFRQFPNNRFAARAYARFLIDITAEHALSAQMIEQIRLLQRGISVNLDQTRELGLATFKALPNRTKSRKEMYSTGSVSESVQSSVAPDLQMEGDDDRQIDLDQIMTLKNRIESLSVPAIVGTRIARIMFLLLFFLAPIAFALVYLQYWVNTLQEPLDYMSQMSRLRALTFQIASFSFRHVGENLSVFNDQDIYPNSVPPAEIGGSWDTAIQLRHILGETSRVVQETSSFRKFKQKDPDIEQAQDLIFGQAMNYKFYTSPTTYEVATISLQSAVIDLIVQQNTIVLQDVPLDPSIMNTSALLNLFNAEDIISTINQALEHITDYIQALEYRTKSISNIVLGVVVAFYVIVQGIAMALEVIWITRNKNEAYRCLVALPKNTVSNLAENLRVIKKDNENNNLPSNVVNTEMNKQEENIMKIFNTGGASETPLSDILLLVLCSFVMIGLGIGCAGCLVQLVQYEVAKLSRAAPHLDYLLGSYALNLGGMSAVLRLIMYYTEYRIPIDTIDQIRNAINSRFAEGNRYYFLARYGGAQAEQTPFGGFSVGLDAANAVSSCSKIEGVAQDLKQASDCFPADMIASLIQPLVRDGLQPLADGLISKLDAEDPLWDFLWHILIRPMYDSYIMPMYSTIIVDTKADLDRQRSNSNVVVYILIVLAILVEAAVIVQLYFIERHIRSVLKLLLHCPPEVILSTPRIMKVFSGDFSTLRSDSMNRDSEFYDSVFMSLLDAIMFANSDMIIQAANLSCTRIFGDIDLIGKNIKSFFTDSERFRGNVENLFSSVGSVSPEKLVFKKDNGGEVHLEVSRMFLSGKIVISCRDITQTVRYNSLIREERAKSDQLLATILPKSLVKRVQEGEKNISFSVQSASILFLDIVGFTPWCGSLPAVTVMATLNTMFKRLDAILAMQHTMTKIKCIGDCYMAAGGIFSEVNQPATHAKEVVVFGLKSIRAIIDLNRELNENLKIRVGVNTGGPIVAGVLGIGKPTFEILGPAINMAQQMEHHGLPMAVHITRSVYELIYGDSFKVHERGMVEVKGGRVLTYLVTQDGS